jgi:hypothetical protein
MKQTEKIYGGSSRVVQTKFGELTTISQSKKDLQNLLAYLNDNNLEWVNLKIVEKREKVANKPTHYLEVDTWKPDGNKKVAEPTNEVPF